jgi:hypothetical protein
VSVFWPLQKSEHTGGFGTCVPGGGWEKRFVKMQSVAHSRFSDFDGFSEKVGITVPKILTGNFACCEKDFGKRVGNCTGKRGMWWIIGENVRFSGEFWARCYVRWIRR